MENSVDTHTVKKLSCLKKKKLSNRAALKFGVNWNSYSKLAQLGNQFNLLNDFKLTQTNFLKLKQQINFHSVYLNFPTSYTITLLGHDKVKNNAKVSCPDEG